MINSVEYEFASQPIAYRFLNTVKHFDADKLSVRYGRTNLHVKVAYQPKIHGFDSTLSQLDELAAEMGGSEV